MTESDKVLAGGKYRIEKALGQGGMGAVYLAVHEALGKKFAVKEMELRGLSDRELASAVKQFNTEARFLANLDHPNLVQVTDFFVEGDKHYLVMAYVAGETLQQKLRARGKPFGWPQVLEWARPLCDVLAYLHNQTPPILFRDLKPSNIMVEDSGRLKLIDFGIARTGSDGERTSTFLQGTGTSGFSPIEQYGGHQSTDHRSDIYSLSATLYQLLTGKVPPDAVSRVSQGAQVQGPSTLFPELPSSLDAVLLKALAMNKQDRHQSISEFAQALEQIGLSTDDNSDTEDLRPPALVAAMAAPSATGPTSGLSSGSPAAPPPANGSSSPGTTRSAPNITVELVPSRPATSPAQMAAALGGAAVVALLMGGFLLPRLTGGGVAVAATSTPKSAPLAAPTATSSDTAKEQGTSKATASSERSARPPVPARPTEPVTTTSRGNDSEQSPPDRMQRVSRRAQAEPGEEPVENRRVSQPRPRVATAASKIEPAYPTAARRVETRKPEPDQPAPAAVPVQRPDPPQQPPSPIHSAGGLTHREGDPPDVWHDSQGRPTGPDGRPLKLDPATGRPLPREMQDPPPPGPGHGPASGVDGPPSGPRSSGPPGY